LKEDKRRQKYTKEEANDERAQGSHRKKRERNQGE